MSEENFSAALKEYFNKYAWKNASLNDFIVEMQKHFHVKEFTLEEWKYAWLEKASLNNLEAVWDKTEGENKHLKILQTPFTKEYQTLRPHQI